MRRTTRKEPVYGEQGNRLISLSRQVGSIIAANRPVLWYDFGDESLVTVSSGQAISIADKGSRGWNLTRTTTGPQYVTGINGRKCIDWGSVTHSNLLRNTSSTATTLADIYVILDASFGASFAAFAGLVSNSGDPGWTVYGSGTSLAGSINQAYINGSTTNTISSVLPAINSPSLLRLKHSATPIVSSGGFQIGSERSNANRGWYGLIGEVVVFSEVLDSQNSAAVVTELMGKWGITA